MNLENKNNSDGNLNAGIEICSMKFSLRPLKGLDATLSDTEKSIDYIQIPNFNMISQKFNTVLQMQWKYMHSIGAVAQNTAISNLASLPILLREVIEREKIAGQYEIPIAEAEFKITIRDKNKNEETKEIMAKVYDHSHLISLDEFRQYNNAALKILNESALQQIVNAYENLLCELCKRSINRPC
jgi:hypothetical protein